MKYKKLAILSILAVLSGVSVLGTNAHADTEINTAKYTTNIQKLQKIFQKKNKKFELEKIQVENNNDTKKEPVYVFEGVNKDKTKEAKLKVNADKTNEVIKSKTEKIDADDKNEIELLDLQNVKQEPSDAIKLAQKYAKTKDAPTEWTLENEKISQKQIPVYKIKFKDDHKQIEVRLNAQNGNKISIENDD